jgi:membrane-associated protein
MLDGSIDWTELFTKLDHFLFILATQHKQAVYAVLFGIIFLETALIFMAFLPGDSLLFVAGAVAATGAMNPWLLMLLLIIASITGNTVGYGIGAWFGRRIYDGSLSWVDPEALDKTNAFYKRHGGKTLVIARFVPLVRSAAPLVAGAALMPKSTFQLYSILGGVFWVVSLVGAGYLFGQVPIIRDNLGTILIVGMSVVIVPATLAGLWRWATVKKRRKGISE